MYKLDKLLYHGTTAMAAVYACGTNEGFRAPVYLTESKERAEHYAKAAAAYIEHEAKERGIKLIKEGYAIITFRSLPNKDFLKPDDYNPEAEPNQWIYLKPIVGYRHFSVEYHPLEATDEQRLYLRCFAIGMWRG